MYDVIMISLEGTTNQKVKRLSDSLQYLDIIKYMITHMTKDELVCSS